MGKGGGKTSCCVKESFSLWTFREVAKSSETSVKILRVLYKLRTLIRKNQFRRRG
jgi:hypothetical protein